MPRNANAAERASASDAETVPLRNPELRRYDMNPTAIAEVWRRCSVVGSRLLDLTADALLGNAQFAAFGGHVEQGCKVAK